MILSVAGDQINYAFYKILFLKGWKANSSVLKENFLQTHRILNQLLLLTVLERKYRRVILTL